MEGGGHCSTRTHAEVQTCTERQGAQHTHTPASSAPVGRYKPHHLLPVLRRRCRCGPRSLSYAWSLSLASPRGAELIALCEDPRTERRAHTHMQSGVQTEGNAYVCGCTAFGHAAARGAGMRRISHPHSHARVGTHAQAQISLRYGWLSSAAWRFLVQYFEYLFCASLS